MNVLVTGGTGYLGRAVVRALAAAGHAPVVFARSASASGLPARLIDGDVRSAESVRNAAEGCDAICHMAALVAVWRRRRTEFDEVTIGGLHNVLRAAASTRVRRIIYTSSFLALPPRGASHAGTWNDYQRTKVAADRVARDAQARGFPIVRCYPGVLYGPGPATEGNLVGRMIADHLAGRLPGIVGADHIWSYTWLDDVAAAYVAALEREQVAPEYRLGGENLPQRRVFELVAARTGCRVPRRIPTSFAILAGGMEEAIAGLTGRSPRLTIGTVEVLLRDWPLDSGSAMADLGYQVTPLADGIARMLGELWPPTAGRS